MTGSLAYILSNSEADRDAVMKQCEEFGKREGGGAAARANFYVELTEMSKAKRIDVTNAPQCWDSYDKGAAQGASIIGGFKEPKNPEDTRKVRISECRQFIKLGSLTMVDGVEVLDRAVSIIKKARQEQRLKSKPTDAMINVAREQCKDEQNPLEDDTIEVVIQPKEGVEIVEADALDQIRDRLERVVKKFGDSDEINDALGYIQKRIGDLGGTSRSIKAAAAVAKKAAKAKK